MNLYRIMWGPLQLFVGADSIVAALSGINEVWLKDTKVEVELLTTDLELAQSDKTTVLVIPETPAPQAPPPVEKREAAAAKAPVGRRPRADVVARVKEVKKGLKPLKKVVAEIPMPHEDVVITVAKVCERYGFSSTSVRTTLKKAGALRDDGMVAEAKLVAYMNDDPRSRPRKKQKDPLQEKLEDIEKRLDNAQEKLPAEGFGAQFEKSAQVVPAPAPAPAPTSKVFKPIEKTGDIYESILRASQLVGLSWEEVDTIKDSMQLGGGSGWVNLTQLRAYIAHPSFIKPVIVEPEEVDDTKEALTQL